MTPSDIIGRWMVGAAGYVRDGLGIKNERVAKANKSQEGNATLDPAKKNKRSLGAIHKLR